MAIFSVNLGSRHGLFYSLHFFIKLIIAIAIDFFGLLVGIGNLIPGFGQVGNVAYAAIQAIIVFAFYGNGVLSFLLFAGEALPALNLIPFTTIAVLYMGYKSGWKH